MGECSHIISHKMGHDRYGRQRWRCVDCGRTWGEGAKGLTAPRLSPEKEQQLAELLQAGLGVREICRRVGVCRHTVTSRSSRVIVPAKKPRLVGPNECDQCGRGLIGEREFYRRTRRTKHKFCSNECYQRFYWELRGRDCCSRCGMARRDITAGRMTRGLCPNCYAHLRRFGFDEQVAEDYQLATTLERESHNARKRQAESA